VTNALAYYENPKITAVKSFTVQAPGGEQLIQSVGPELVAANILPQLI